MTYLVIGLGNPGAEYENTRHNIGRDALFNFVNKNDLADFKDSEKLKSLVSEGKLGKQKVITLLPETYMNRSGEAAEAAIKYFKVKSENTFIVHDDIDLPFGKMKISFGKSSGGHKGIDNVMRKLKTKEFWRIRIGINPTKKKKDAMDVVLKKFSKKDDQEIKKLKKKINEALLCALTESPEKAMTIFNQ